MRQEILISKVEEHHMKGSKTSTERGGREGKRDKGQR